MRTTALAVSALLLATLTACGSDDSDNARDTPTKPPTTAPSDKAATATPNPPAADAMTFGTEWEWPNAPEGVAGTSTVLAYRQPVAVDGPQPEDAFGSESKGYVWAAAELKVCTSTGGISVSNQPWALKYEDGTRIKPSDTTYDSFPRPSYPAVDTELLADDCMRGQVTFAVPGDRRPERVIYDSQSLPKPAQWAVPAR